jgi:2-polyprenyl-3-methyl-5-hydroxy-6-metoxy-1,4-benzoquinol methylase
VKTFSKEPGDEPRKRIRCPVCGSTSTRELWSYPHYTFVRCPVCTLVYQNPQPLPDNLFERYDDEYFAYEIENEEAYFNLMKLGLDDIGFDAVTADLTVSRRAVVDIGCATGRLLSSLKDSGWRVQGVEVCRPSAEYGIKTYGIPIHIGTLESARLPDASFEIVHCSHLIEHLTDPVSFLAEVRRVMGSDGRFILSTPNISGFQEKLMSERWRSAIPDHLFLYSKKTLTRLLESNGFRVLGIKTWGGIGQGIAPGWIKKPADTLAKKLGLGDVMIVLARRTT